MNFFLKIYRNHLRTPCILIFFKHVLCIKWISGNDKAYRSFRESLEEASNRVSKPHQIQPPGGYATQTTLITVGYTTMMRN